MYSLDNDFLRIGIAAQGAELQYIRHTQTNLSYLWNGDRQYWKGRSPILFPIVGALKDNTYYYKDQAYQLSKHGFARDKRFHLNKIAQNLISFSFGSDAATLKHYPFHFNFTVEYTLDQATLHIAYTVHNTGMEEMYFSCGAHPAFTLPLTENTCFEDWKITFDRAENLERWKIMSNGLIANRSENFLKNPTREIPLHKSLFYQDALVFKNITSTTISLVSDKSPHGLSLDKNDFPYLGIWSAKDAPFVCIEPWYGIADSIDTNSKIGAKEGIITLSAQSVWHKSLSITFF